MGIAHETVIFLYACLLGSGLGVVYDVFRLLRLLLFKNRVVVFLEDLLFCSICTLLTLAFLVEFCFGRLRLFVLLGEFLGFLVYHFTVGELVMRIFKGILMVLKGVFTGIYRIFVFPIWKIACRIAQLIRNIFVGIAQCFGRLPFLNKLHLQPPAAMMYNKRNKHIRRNKGGVSADES